MYILGIFLPVREDVTDRSSFADSLARIGSYQDFPRFLYIDIIYKKRGNPHGLVKRLQVK
jgi:hypothetical protein